MTEKNNSHARRVTVSRTGVHGHKSDPSERKVVAVRLKGEREAPRPADVLSRETQTISAEEASIPQDIPVGEADSRDEPVYAEVLPQDAEAAEPPTQNEEAGDTPPEHALRTSESAEITPEEKYVPCGADDGESSACDETAAETIAPSAEIPDDDPSECVPESAEPAEEAAVSCTPIPCCEQTPSAEPPVSTELTDQPPVTETAAELDIDDPVMAVDPAAISESDSAAEVSPAPPAKWYIPQQWADISLPRRIIMILSVALFLFSCLPVFVGVISPGIVPPVMIAAFFFLCALYWPLIDGCESTWGNVLIAVVAVCVLAGVTYLSFVSGKMISASANTLPEDRSDVTVVVLGCKINGDKPSRMLHARLEEAAEFLLEHPQSHCIVTGGQGTDEDYPEAFVMRNYLVDKGVSPMRIVMETQSTSTLENITFSAELAEQYNCHERFLIVTDRFHQYRAMRTANDLGIVSYALNVETAWYLAMPYWFREMVAITRDWITA